MDDAWWHSLPNRALTFPERAQRQHEKAERQRRNAAIWHLQREWWNQKPPKRSVVHRVELALYFIVICWKRVTLFPPLNAINIMSQLLKPPMLDKNGTVPCTFVPGAVRNQYWSINMTQTILNVTLTGDDVLLVEIGCSKFCSGQSEEMLTSSRTSLCGQIWNLTRWRNSPFDDIVCNQIGQHYSEGPGQIRLTWQHRGWNLIG